MIATNDTWVDDPEIQMTISDETQSTSFVTSADTSESPPTANQLKWADYQEIEKQRIRGIDAETAWKNKGSLEVDWGGPLPTKNAQGMLESTVKVTKIVRKDFTSIFNRENSYIVTGEQTGTLLEHERLHLRIAEYIATKALANFSEDDILKITVTATGKDIDSLGDTLQGKIDDAVNEKLNRFIAKWETMDRAVQEAYDQATNHGKKPTEQADWAAKYKQFADAILKAKGWAK